MMFHNIDDFFFLNATLPYGENGSAKNELEQRTIRQRGGQNNF